MASASEDPDLEDPERDARVRREPDVAVGEEEDDRGGEEHPEPPLTGPVPRPFSSAVA